MAEAVQLFQPLRGVQLVSPVSTSAGNGGDEMADGEGAAYERGLRDGASKLNQQLLQQRNEFLELQRGVLQSLTGAVTRVVRDSESALIALTVETAQKLVAGLPVTAEMVDAAVREGLSQVEEAAEIFVSLHPEDLALLQKVNSPLLAPVAGGPKIHVRSSSEVTRGGCIVQTRFGVIDARRETKVELLKKSLQT